MSKNIHEPRLATVEEHSSTSATFVVEPLHTGYGHTLGNSLRRVLLSSIEGAAITAFKIEGVSHEFSSVPGIKEDVIDIMQNLKLVRFRLHSDEPQTLRLEKKGSGPVTASEIAKNADVEVVNGDAVICTLDDPKGMFVMDLVVDSGRGYRSIEESGEKRLTSDMIPLDAVFSPIERVRYKVENTRVGQATNLDKLLLTIDTDASLTPRAAFEEAAAILVNQYTALAGTTRVQTGATSSNDVENDGNDLMTSIEDLNLSARTTNALINNDIRTVSDLVTLGDAEMRELKGFGSKAMDEVRDKMAELEL